ncbi:hypothetical protein GW766_02090, partial [Candidatus Parcubacteria bacterium]|nr:hypothetical protein [Candidatus Parcubacteria bacterium]
DSERMLLSENDAVLINGTVAGKVTQIAPAVDSATGKTEVRIAAEGTDIVNGDTVRITKEFSDTVASTEAVVTVPLSAIKFEIENGFVFVVTEGVLKARPVTLGVVRGGTAEITAGITGTEPFVKDARGLQEGVSVEIIK